MPSWLGWGRRFPEARATRSRSAQGMPAFRAGDRPSLRPAGGCLLRNLVPVLEIFPLSAPDCRFPSFSVANAYNCQYHYVTLFLRRLSNMNRFSPKTLLLAIFLLALFLRLPGIVSRPIWYGELFLLLICHQNQGCLYIYSLNRFSTCGR